MSRSTREMELDTVLSSLRDRLEILRARLYLLDPDGSYRLAASIGFVPRFGPEEVLGRDDPLLEWVRDRRRPAYANSPGEAGRLASVMEREHYARALAAPIYVGSLLVGVLELQDKARGGLYGDEDVLRLETPLIRLRELAAELAFDVLPPSEKPEHYDPEPLFLDPTQREPSVMPAPPHLFTSADRISRDTASRDALAAPATMEVTARELAVFRGFYHLFLMSAEVEAVVFSHWTARRADVYVGARRPLPETARQALLRDLQSAVTSAVPHFPSPPERVFHVEHPLGQAPGAPEDFAGIQTSVVSSSPASALLFTMAFSRQLSQEKRRPIKEAHRLVRSAVTDAAAAARYQAAYRSLVNAFVEPGIRPYRQLRAHSLAVGLLCRRFASILRLPAEVIEQVTVAGLLHDVGLRELELPYEKIAGRRPLDLQELAIVRQHPLAGEAVLKRIDFPYPITALVRHHHERFDGSGYPDRLAGEKIPLGARLIGIAEAYDAMTAEHSYRAPIPRDEALAIIRDRAGSQFDPDLALRFIDLVRSDGDAARSRLTSPPRN